MNAKSARSEKREARGQNSLLFFILLASSISLLAPLKVRSAFEDIGAGARPLGMGSAFSAVADDANTVYYNPAGLGQLRHPQFTAGYGKLSLGLTDGSDLGSGHLAFTAPLQQGRWGAFGGHVLNLQLSGIYKENIFALAYGKNMFSSLTAGVSAKWMKRSYGSDAYTDIDPLFQKKGKSVSVVGIDLGLLYRHSRHHVFALTAKDFNKPDVGLGEADQVPTSWKGAYAFYQRSFVVTGEVTRKEKDLNLSFGGERWFMAHKVAGRGGFDFGSGNRRNLAMGASLRLGNAQLDYAFLLPLAGLVDTGGSHRLSFTIRFGHSDEKSVALLEQEELLGQSVADTEVERMREDLDRMRKETEASQKEAAQIRARILELEGQIKNLKQAAASPLLLQPSKPTIQYPKAPTPIKPRPAPVKETESQPKLEQMEQELQRLRQELQKRDQEKTIPFKRPGVYTVQTGDTLQSIAQKTLGDAGRWAEIFQANKDRIKRGGEVAPGQVLIVP
jgi:hypothetical protein